jgi:choline dehydrogenase
VVGLCFEAKETLPPPNNNLSSSAFFWKSRAALPRPDLMVVSAQVPLVSPEIAEMFSIPPNAFSVLPALMRVESRGFLKLLTTGRQSELEIQPNFLAEQADVEALLAGIELALDITDQPPYQKLIRNWVAPTGRMNREQSISFLRRSVQPYFHPVGTCAMGSGPESVVDARLRVNGIEGLRIADASVMPTIPSANTNAPTVMIAEAAARFVSAADVSTDQ